MDHGSDMMVPLRLALTSSSTEETTPKRSRCLLVSVLVVSLVALALALSPWIGPLALKIAIILAAIAANVATWFATRGKTSAKPSNSKQPGNLLIDDHSIRLTRAGDPTESLISLSSGFGLTLLTTVDRSRLALALTTSQGMLCVGSDVDPIDHKRLESLIPRAVTVSRNELMMASFSPGGECLMVDSTSLLQLLDMLTQLDATSLGRLILTDHQGREVSLEPDRLTTPMGTIRLDQPFEWRGLRFCEGSATWDAEFQATWVRQGMEEVVLVSLPVGDIRDSLHELKHHGVRPDAMLRQDARLAHGARSLPPPLEQRVAVDRLFMPALRRALDSAHVDTRKSIPGGASLR